MKIANGFVKTEHGVWVNMDEIREIVVVDEQDGTYSIFAYTKNMLNLRPLLSGLKTEEEAQEFLNTVMTSRRL